MIPLPASFYTRMQTMLSKEELSTLMQAFSQPSVHGLRYNPNKWTKDGFLQQLPFDLNPVPWCPTGFYYNKENRPGKHPYHAAGLYYLQEPSAMAVIEALCPSPGEKVLDLCAAPGGKSTQISGYLGQEGLLVANEIEGGRAKILAENLERWGATNVLITNERPGTLSQRFPNFFDKIVVDAPCSGEGMFRKLPEAVQDWSPAKVAHCASMQKDILDDAAKMLQPGGVIIYSTCTFAPEENEKQIEAFLERHEEFLLDSVSISHYFKEGVPTWGNKGETTLSRTMRLWPHHIAGEGHFVARLQHQQNSLHEDKEPTRESTKKNNKTTKEKKSPPEAMKLYASFCQDALTFEPKGCFSLFGEQLYLVSPSLPNLDRLKVVRPGWHLGTLKKGRFEPSHALALGLQKGQWKRSIDFSPDNNELLLYLKGETLNVSLDYENGWTLVTVDGHPLGWGKVVNGQLKNHYPKGLRWVN